MSWRHALLWSVAQVGKASEGAASCPGLGRNEGAGVSQPVLANSMRWLASSKSFAHPHSWQRVASPPPLIMQTADPPWAVDRVKSNVFEILKYWTRRTRLGSEPTAYIYSIASLASSKGCRVTRYTQTRTSLCCRRKNNHVRCVDEARKTIDSSASASKQAPTGPLQLLTALTDRRLDQGKTRKGETVQTTA